MCICFQVDLNGTNVFIVFRHPVGLNNFLLVLTMCAGSLAMIEFKLCGR